LGDAEGMAKAELELAKLRDSDPAMVALDARLAAIIKADQQPNDNAERLRLAQRAYDKALHATAARLWCEALANDSSLGDDRQAQHRYNAACAAALAAASSALPQGEGGRRPGEGSQDAHEASPRPSSAAVRHLLPGGEGSGEKSLTDAERAAFRAQALAYLRAELEVWSKLLESANDGERAAIGQTLNHWRKVDTDLSSVRDASIAELSEAERAGWNDFWKQVDDALAKCGETQPQPEEARP
jgi:hypothetical protein